MTQLRRPPVLAADKHPPDPADALHQGGEPRDYVVLLVDVPSLEVVRSKQRYEPVAPGLVRFRSGDFEAMLELDADGFVTRYPGLAVRVCAPARPLGSSVRLPAKA